MLDFFADVTKCDTVTNRVLLHLNLARRTKLIPTHSFSANSVVDGKSTYGVAYDRKRKLLYTISPTTGDYDGRRIRLLGFHLPGLTFADAIPPDITDELAKPRVENDSSGAVVVLNGEQTMRLEHGHVVHIPTQHTPPLPGSVPDDVNQPTYWSVPLRLYRTKNLGHSSAADRFSYRPLEQSGTSVLVTYFLPGVGVHRGFAVGDWQSKTITGLNLPFAAFQDNVHLAPGGRFVVAQEGHPSSSAGFDETGSSLALLVTATGQVRKRWQRADLAKRFLTLTPAGSLKPGTTYCPDTLILSMLPEAVGALASGSTSAITPLRITTTAFGISASRRRSTTVAPFSTRREPSESSKVEHVHRSSPQSTLTGALRAPGCTLERRRTKRESRWPPLAHAPVDIHAA